MKISGAVRRVHVAGRSLRLRRTTGGVVELWGEDDAALAAGLGFAHAHDRMVQMMLVRLVAQGRLSECLEASDEALAIDVFMREMGMWRLALEDVERCTPEARGLAEAYASGVNAYLVRHGRPLELRMVGYDPEPWTPADTLATINVMAYVGLAQTQQDMEKLIIQALRGGASLTGLRALFAPHLDGLDEETVALVREVRLHRPTLPASTRFLGVLPALVASNNWAVAGSRTASGHAMECHDPHLECNRLPAIWYEAVMHTADDFRIGLTMPGVPGLVMGRTRNVSMGFTYGFMDMIDYFIEEIRDGRCRRGDGFVELDVRRETVLRRKLPPIRLTLRASDRGALEADPEAPEVEDGYYLARAWSFHGGGAAGSLEALVRVVGAESTPEALEILAGVTLSCNWIVADRHGSIGYQQSGLAPRRRHSGLYPVPAWDEALAWQGLVDNRELHRVLDPEEGFLATANNEINPPDGPVVCNLPMGPYRVGRISDLLRGRSGLTVDDMKAVQLDLVSAHAGRLMELVRPHLPSTPVGEMLRGWDLRYGVDSRGATLFEAVYHALLRRVFGTGLLGDAAWDRLIHGTGLLDVYYHLFDQALMNDRWFGPEGREAVVAEVVGQTLSAVTPEDVRPWGEVRRVVMRNVFFGGKLPAFLGFDHGPIQLPGGRGTVVQGGVFESHGRLTTFFPSARFITDLGRDEAETVLAGGPSGRRFSGYYRTDIERWLHGRYKTLRA